MLAQMHLDEIKACLSSSPILQTVSVLTEYSGYNHGYFRAKATLINGDFLEVAEYFIMVCDSVQIQRYRHHWMDKTRNILKKRWDNAKLPKASKFPSPHSYRLRNQGIVGLLHGHFGVDGSFGTRGEYR